MKSIDAFLGFSLDQLTMFVAVVDAGTFAGASREIGRVQSAVSTAVANLERALGTPLFERVGRKSVLTEAGRRLAAEARLALAQAREVASCAASLRAGVEPSLAVAVNALFPRRALARACHALHLRFPTVTLRLFEDTLGLARVADGDADLGICNLIGDASPADVVTRPMGAITLVPVCAAGHPLARAPAPQAEHQLRSAVQIVLTEHGAARHEDQGVLATRTWRVTDLQTKLELLRAGVGWGSMPHELIDDDLARGALVRLRPAPWPDGHVIRMHAVVRGGAALGPAGRWLEDALTAELS